MKKVICIMGPTASGKTKLSIELAKVLKTDIINGDSVQIFDELNIGSAKIKEDEKEGITHHLLGIKKVGEPYTVFDFQKDARNLIEKIDIPVIVGGSGLYIKSALYNYKFEQNTDENLDISLDEKIQFIKENDPSLIIDFKNDRRIESAYRNIKSGSLRSLKTEKNEALYDVYLIYLDLNRDILKERLIKRLDIMLQEGFIEETKGLLHHELNIIGYREVKKYLNNEVTLDKAKEEIITTSMRFAKRQRTWFINQMNPHVYNALDENLLKNVSKDVLAFLKGE